MKGRVHLSPCRRRVKAFAGPRYPGGSELFRERTHLRRARRAWLGLVGRHKTSGRARSLVQHGVESNVLWTYYVGCNGRTSIPGIVPDIRGGERLPQRLLYCCRSCPTVVMRGVCWMNKAENVSHGDGTTRTRCKKSGRRR